MLLVMPSRVYGTVTGDFADAVLATDYMYINFVLLSLQSRAHGPVNGD
jgi:hypothetical protein